MIFLNPLQFPFYGIFDKHFLSKTDIKGINYQQQDNSKGQPGADCCGLQGFGRGRQSSGISGMKQGRAEAGSRR